MKIFGLIAAAILGIVGVGTAPVPAQAATVCTITITQANADASDTKTFTGTSSGDVICVYANNVTVDALAGDDTVIDYGDDNVINLGDGADILDSTAESCVVTVNGGDGSDTIRGTECSDKLNGEDDDDYLMGESGEDTLNGGDGPDLLVGGVGIDTITGGLGLNVCDPGAGDITSTCDYDDEAPTFSDVSFSNHNVDVRTQDSTQTISIRLKDALGIDTSGRSNYVFCRIDPSPANGFYVGPGLSGLVSTPFYSPTGQDLNNLALGRTIITNNRDVILDMRINIPRNSRSGTYQCFGFFADVLNNRVQTNFGSFVVTGSNLIGTNNTSDLTISTPSPSNQVVEVGATEQVVDLKYRLKSAKGVSNYGQATVYCTAITATSIGRGPSATGFAIQPDGKALTLGSSDGLTARSVGTNNDVMVTVPVKFRQGLQPAVYKCKLNGPSLPTQTPELTITITRTGTGFDDFAPSITEQRFSNSKLEVGSSAATTDLHFRAEDKTAIDYIQIDCQPKGATTRTIGELLRFTPEGNLVSMMDFDEETRMLSPIHQISSSGTKQDLAVDISLKFRAGTLPGVYVCIGQTTDSLGNSRLLTFGELQVFRTPVGQPSPPTGLNFLGAGPTKGLLTWTSSEGAYGYVAQYSTDGVIWQDYIGGGATNTTSMPISGLLGSKDYWIRVRSDNGGIPESDLKYTSFMDLSWTAIKIRTSAPVRPEAPTGLGVKASKGSVTLMWTAPADNGGSVVRDYVVQYSKNGKTWFTVSHKRSNSTTIKISKLRSKTTYTFRVQAVTNVGKSGSSKSIRVKTK